MKLLFIGGTGIISSACSALAVERGHELHVLCRGRTERPLPPGVVERRGDIRDPESVARALGDERFDAVTDFVAFTPAHVEADLRAFSERTEQYVFISSASAYKKPILSLPIVESTLLDNPFWAYSRDKIACEERLVRAYREQRFPMTIVRPSHTYDRTLLPFDAGFTVLERMRRGKPVVVHGDGTSLWVLTHHRDFAHAFLGLLGNPHAIGETYHITSDELQTWDQIYRTVASALGVQAKLVHVPSDKIAAVDENWGASLLGDKAHSVIFDNTKIKRAVPDYVARIPFAEGAREIAAYYRETERAHPIDQRLDRLMDDLVAGWG
ncbi:MAG TPA: SDR family oxidoreductase [Polyangiaceae bacterium]